MRIEDYIMLRRKQDLLDETDISKKTENIHKIIDYVFDYYKIFESDISVRKKEEKVNNRLARYLNEIDYFSEETQQWLLQIYSYFDIKIYRYLKLLLDNDNIFLLMQKGKQMQKLSYVIFSKASNKYTFLNEYPNEILSFMLEYRKICYDNNGFKLSSLKISPKTKKFIKKYYEQNGVNLYAWGHNYLNSFLNDRNAWPLSHVIIELDEKNNELVKYDINAKRDVFCLNTVFDSLDKETMIVLKAHKKEIVDLLQSICIIKRFK